MTSQTDAPLERQYVTQASDREAVGLVRLVGDGDLLLDTPYQRDSVWILPQRRALIRSWLMGLPIPALIINSRENWPEVKGTTNPGYAVVDGKQRTLTAMAWYGDDFAVPASWFPADQVACAERTEDGPYVRWSGLALHGQRYFMRRARFPVCEARAATVAEEAQIFLLVNGSGTAQTGDDLARARSIAGV